MPAKSHFLESEGEHSRRHWKMPGRWLRRLTEAANLMRARADLPVPEGEAEALPELRSQKPRSDGHGSRAGDGFGRDGDGAGAAGGVEFALEAFQIAAQIGGGLVAHFAIFFESFADDAFEFRRKIGIEANRGDRKRDS